MVKSDIVQKLFELNPQIFRKDLEKAVDLIFSYMENVLTKGSRIEIRGLGIFSVKKRNARKSRNPKTGETIFIGEKKFPIFKMSKLLSLKINEKTN